MKQAVESFKILTRPCKSVMHPFYETDEKASTFLYLKKKKVYPVTYKLL